MTYTKKYNSPLGDILLAEDDIGLIGLWFDKGKNYADILCAEHIEKETATLKETIRWLDLYFDGKEPDFIPPLHLIGTPFQKKVWEILLQIPYGKTVTYKSISKQIENKTGIKKMSSQAVGNAIGHNEVSIIIPCHHVVGTNGSLTGYSGGLERKIKLLEIEKADMSHLFVPQKRKVKIESKEENKQRRIASIW